MPSLVINNAANEEPAVIGGLFDGLAFFLTQRLPSRTQLIADIQSNGGRVVKLEKHANFVISDHLRRDAPHGSFSYKFIEEALREGEIPSPAKHAVCSDTGPARTVGSSLPPKGTRTEFTAEDDRILWQFVQKEQAKGESVKGNMIYKRLEDINPRHTYQAWRSRYVKRLIDQPPIASEAGMQQDAVPGPVVAIASQEEHTSKDGRMDSTPLSKKRKVATLECEVERRRTDDLGRRSPALVVGTAGQHSPKQLHETIQGTGSKRQRSEHELQSMRKRDLEDFELDDESFFRGEIIGRTADRSTNPAESQAGEISAAKGVLSELTATRAAAVLRLNRMTDAIGLSDKTFDVRSKSPASEVDEVATNQVQREPVERVERVIQTRKSRSDDDSDNGTGRISTHIESNDEDGSHQAPRSGRNLTQDVVQQDKSQSQFVDFNSSVTRSSGLINRLHEDDATTQVRSGVSEDIQSLELFPYRLSQLYSGSARSLESDDQVGLNVKGSLKHKARQSADTPHHSSAEKWISRANDDTGVFGDTALWHKTSQVRDAGQATSASLSELNDEGRLGEDGRDHSGVELEFSVESEMDEKTPGDLGTPQSIQPASTTRLSNARGHPRKDDAQSVIELSSSSLSIANSQSPQSPRKGAGRPHSQALETQDIYNAQTQYPNLSIPAPPDSDDERGEASDEGEERGLEQGVLTDHTPMIMPSPSAHDDAEIQEVDIASNSNEPPEENYEQWQARMYRLGFANPAVNIQAFKCTTMDPELAEYVLRAWRIAGSGGGGGGAPPDDMPGVWTSRDDEWLEGGDARNLRAVEMKHGQERCMQRREWLEHFWEED